MTGIPFNPSANGAPAPGQQSFPMPPGQATYNAPVPAQPATVVREGQWQGYPSSAIPPMPQPQPQYTGQQPGYQPPPQQQPQQMPQGYPQAYVPQAVPTGQWQPGMPVPTQHPQPQTQPGQVFQQPGQQPQGQPMPQGGLDPNTILQGPAFPAELQGVTLGQAITLYGGMRNLVLNLQTRQAQMGGQPQPQAQPQGQPQQQPGQPQVPATLDWRNPMPQFEAMFARMLDERLAPVQQQAHFQGAAQARAAVAQELGPQRFAQLEPHIARYLAGADPQALSNPELWRVAARTAIGELTLSGQQQQGGQQPPAPGYGGAVPFRPGMQNPAPSLQSFFTEPPQGGGQPVQGVTLTPQQMWFADQMGVSYSDYAAYSQGVPQQLPNGGRR